MILDERLLSPVGYSYQLCLLLVIGYLKHFVILLYQVTEWS